MLRRRKRHGPIGLDIGAAGVKLLQLADADGHPTLVAAAHYDVTHAGDDAERREAAIRQALEDALRSRTFVGRDVVAALGSGEFQMKSLRLPKMPESDRAAAVEFEAQDRFDMGGRPAQIRHVTAGEVRHGNEIKDEVIVFAAADDLVEQRLALLESLRLRPLALDLSPCAVARSFIRFLRRAEDAQAVNVFIDAGWRGTSIIITHGTDIAFLKLLDIGGQHFTEAVAKALNLAPPKALELRVRRMREALNHRSAAKEETSAREDAGHSSIPPEIDAAMSDAIRPLIERMLRDIQLCLRYFAVTFRGHRSECLTFVGGEASEPSLTQIIGEGVDVPCIIGHPLRGIENIDAIGGRQRRTIQPAWAAACGLALRGSSWVRPHASRGPTPERAASASTA